MLNMGEEGEILSTVFISPEETPPLFLTLDIADTAQKDYFNACGDFCIKQSPENINALEECYDLANETFDDSVMAISKTEPDLGKRASQLATLIISEQTDRNNALNLLSGCQDTSGVITQWQALSDEIYDVMLSIDDDELAMEAVADYIGESFTESQAEDLDHFMLHISGAFENRQKRIARMFGKHALGIGQIVAATIFLFR